MMLVKYSLLAGTMLGLIGATPALGQDAAARTEIGINSSDIVVTATRREERLQDVPLAVTALSADTLRTKGVATLLDVGTSVPGLVISNSQGPELAVAMFIRGFGSGDSSQGTTDLPVALYIDGVNVPRSQVSGIDLVTPERIEVLRGPQGQLFGRNAHSGVVQIVSKRPTGEWGGDFSAGFGNFKSVQIRGRVDLPEIAGFRIQLSGNFRKHDGYIKNPYNPNYANATIVTDPASHTQFRNQDFNGNLVSVNTYGGRIAVERDFGNLNAFYSYDNSFGRDDTGYAFLQRSKDTTPTIYNGFSPTQLGGVTFTNFSGPGGTPVTFTQPLLGSKYPKSAYYAVPRVLSSNKASGHIFNLTYTASDNLTLRSITGQRSVTRKSSSALNAATSSVFVGQYDYINSDMFSQELQAIYTTTNFNITSGALFFKEDVTHEITSQYSHNCLSSATAGPSCVPGSSQATTVPNPAAFGAPNFKRSLSNTRAYGLYTQATYTLGPVDLTAGVRYSNDTKKGARVIDRNLRIDEPNGVGVAIRNRFHTSRVDPAFTVKFNFNQDINAYARYAVGFRDGGASVRSSTFSSFDEDEIKSWEVGFKSQLFDRRLTFNVAAFHNTIKGQQLSIQEDPLGDVTRTNFINSAVDRKIKGIELEITAHLLPGLTVGGNYTYLKSSNILFGYDNATLKPFVPEATFSPTTGLIPSAATVAAHPGSQLLLIGPLGTPKHSGTVNVDYVLPVGESDVLFHVDWTRTTNFINASPELAKTRISATGVVTPIRGFNAGVSTNRANARIAFRKIPLGGANGEFSLWMKNVFNHVDPAFAFISDLNTSTILQPPRTMGADFRISF